MSVNAKMTAIADEIRELSGTTAAMGLDAMATNVGAANTEVGTQSNLLDQALAALEGKAAGGSDDGGTLENEMCTVTISYSEFQGTLRIFSLRSYICSVAYSLEAGETIEFQVLKGSVIFASALNSIFELGSSGIVGDVEVYDDDSTYSDFRSIAFKINSDCEITVIQSDIATGGGSGN